MTKCVEVNKERYKSKLINDVLAIEGGVGGGIVPWASNSSKKHDLGDELTVVTAVVLARNTRLRRKRAALYSLTTEYSVFRRTHLLLQGYVRGFCCCTVISGSEDIPVYSSSYSSVVLARNTRLRRKRAAVYSLTTPYSVELVYCCRGTFVVFAFAPSSADRRTSCTAVGTAVVLARNTHNAS